MKKIFVQEYGDLYCYNHEANTLNRINKNCSVRHCFIADEETQVITKTEVVNCNKDDIVIILYMYDGKGNRIYKVVTITDSAARADLEEFINKSNNVMENTDSAGIHLTASK